MACFVIGGADQNYSSIGRIFSAPLTRRSSLQNILNDLSRRTFTLQLFQWCTSVRWVAHPGALPSQLEPPIPASLAVPSRASPAAAELSLPSGASGREGWPPNVQRCIYLVHPVDGHHHSVMAQTVLSQLSGQCGSCEHRCRHGSAVVAGRPSAGRHDAEWRGQRFSSISNRYSLGIPAERLLCYNPEIKYYSVLTILV